jgi:hypothetical protein
MREEAKMVVSAKLKEGINLMSLLNVIKAVTRWEDKETSNFVATEIKRQGYKVPLLIWRNIKKR